MAEISVEASALKTTVKEAIIEALRDEQELLHQIVTEAIEDVALSEAIRRGRKTGLADREEVVNALRSQS